MLKYFNKFETKKIIDIMNIDPVTARDQFEEYLERYPKDYSAHTFYASTLITLGNYDEALKILENVEILADRDTNFNSSSERRRLFERDLLFTKLRLLSYQEKYDEIEGLYDEYYQKIMDANIRGLFFYCKKKLNKLGNIDRSKQSYLFKQIIEYHFEEMLEHIRKHLADCNLDCDNYKTSVFIPGFPIESLLDEIKKYIPSNKCIYPGFFEDVYLFKYTECGKFNYKVTNYFEVVCLHNTDNIITIYPVIIDPKREYIDLDYMKKEETHKVRRISQIDRFNKRYTNK